MKIRKKYTKPAHPWRKERIEVENKLVEEYGLKNKQEVWKTQSVLRGFTRQAKRLIALRGKQADVESDQLLAKLHTLGLLKHRSVSGVLDITVKDLMERRLQTVVYRKGLASSIRQARQFIVHEHVRVSERRISVPSYLVKIDEESGIAVDEKMKTMVVSAVKESPSGESE